MCFHLILETHSWTWTKYILFKEFCFFFTMRLHHIFIQIAIMFYCDKRFTIAFRVHSNLGYHNWNHDTFLSCVLSPKVKWTHFEMLNNEMGICMFRLSTNKCYNEWFKSIEQILSFLFKYKPKKECRIIGYF
jgi:hypothetical protein